MKFTSGLYDVIIKFMIKILRRFIFLLAFFSIPPFTGCKKSQKAKIRTVNIAIQPSAAFIPLYIARYSKSLENALAEKNVRVVWQDFESGPAINESLFADLSDIGLVGDVPAVLALEKGNRIKMVGVPARGPDAYAMLVRRDDNSIQGLEDLKGKKVATFFGSTGHNFTKKILEKTGIDFSEIEFCHISAGDADRVLLAKSIDAIVIWEPNVSRLLKKGLGRVIALGHDINLRGTNAFVVREEYLAQNSDIISIVLDEYEKAVKELPTLEEEYKEELSEALKVQKDEILSIVEKYDYSVAITNDDKASLQDTISFLVSIGNLPCEYSIEDSIDYTCYSE